MGDRRRFADFELDAPARTLRKGDRAMKLHDQPLELLIALTERPGQLVSRDELRRRLWPDDTFVDYDNSLNNALSRLRDCLGDDVAAPRYIETVPKRGYRFIAPIETVDAIGPIDTGPPRTAAQAPWRHTARGRIGVAIAIVVTASLAIALLVNRLRHADAVTIHRLVALPLQNLTGDRGLDYVVDGLSEDLITHLGRLAPRRLAVIARTTAAMYAGAGAPISRIATELSVDYVVEGAVRQEQNRLHVTVRLVRTSDETQMWAEMFDGTIGSLSALFDAMVTKTATGVAAALGEDASVRARAATLDTDAFDAWLRGRHEWNRFTPDGFTASIDWYRRALAVDPGFAPAAAGLARAWAFLGLFDNSRSIDAYAEARKAINEALRLDPGSADALAMRGMVRLFRDFDRDGAVRDFDAVVAREPNDALALHWSAAAASANGDHVRSVALARAAQSLDPKSVAVNADLGWYFYYARRFDEALRQCAEAARLDPSSPGPALCREMVMRAQGKAVVPQGEVPTGDRSALYRAAADNAALGRTEAALSALRSAVASRASWAPFIAVDPAFDRLRRDESFIAIVAATNVSTDPQSARRVR